MPRRFPALPPLLSPARRHAALTGPGAAAGRQNFALNAAETQMVELLFDGDGSATELGETLEAVDQARGSGPAALLIFFG